MSKKITLIWADMIRARLDKSINGQDEYLFKGEWAVREFVKPILKYAEAEEKRITAEFTPEKMKEKADKVIQILKDMKKNDKQERIL